MARKSQNSSTDAAELEAVDKRIVEIDRERRELTDRRRRILDRIRKRRAA